MYKYHIDGGTKLLYIDILRHIFSKRSDWQAVGPKERAHYSDLDRINPLIHNKFDAHDCLVTKEYLAQTMKTSHTPATFILSGRQIVNTNGFPLPPKNDKTKWFLKPSFGWGGKDIVVFNGFYNYPKHIKNRGRYVLQQEVANPMLYEGRKFDIRVYVAFVYHQHKYFVYMFPEALCRTAIPKYSSTVNKSADITNSSMQEHLEGYTSENINKLLSAFEWKDEVYPGFHHIINCALKKMKPVFNKKRNKNAVEIMSFDYIVNQKKEIYLIEINRNLGYGFNRKPENIKKLFVDMFEDLIDFAYIPIINKQFGKVEPRYWIKCCEF